jgi:hypothetical protein
VTKVKRFRILHRSILQSLEPHQLDGAAPRSAYWNGLG